MAGKLLLVLLVLGPALVFTSIITPFEMYVTKFDRMYNNFVAKNPSGNKEKLCESIPKSMDDEAAKGIKLMEAKEGYKNKSPSVEGVLIDGVKRSIESMKESQSIMCKIRINDNDWATLKAAVAKVNAFGKPLQQCFTDLENELSGNPHLQSEIKQWVKLLNELRAIEAEIGEKVTKVREAEVKDMYAKLKSGKISMKDLSGADLFNVVGQMAEEGKLKPGGPFTNVKRD